MTKVKDVQVETIVEHLCTNMSSDKEQLRDISSIGLKTVIGQLPLTASDMAASVSSQPFSLYTDIECRICLGLQKNYWKAQHSYCKARRCLCAVGST